MLDLITDVQHFTFIVTSIILLFQMKLYSFLCLSFSHNVQITHKQIPYSTLMMKSERRLLMNNITYSFERVEKKYLLTPAQYQDFKNRIHTYIEEDTYSHYTICNIYFDTNSYELIRESLRKPPYKEKLRMRSYGTPNKKDTVFLELKKKYDSTVYKRRISCSLEEAQAFLKRGDAIQGNEQVFQEISYFMNFYHPYPKLFLAYDRFAYRGIYEQDLRLTFDFNIRSRTEELDLAYGDYGHPYFPKEDVLMEIKVAQALPLWLVAILSEMKLYPTSFSKYGNIYMKDIASQQVGGLAHV